MPSAEIKNVIVSPGKLLQKSQNTTEVTSSLPPQQRLSHVGFIKRFGGREAQPSKAP